MTRQRAEGVVCRSCGARARRVFMGACECLDPCGCPRYGACACGGRMDRNPAGRGRPRKLDDAELQHRWPEVCDGRVSLRQLAEELGVTRQTISSSARRLGLVRSAP